MPNGSGGSVALPAEAARPARPEAAAGRLPELMAAYQAGELGAFDELYGRLRQPLRRYLLSWTLDSIRTDDLLQETFLQLHRSRRTYLPARPVEPWAFAIARHVYLMDRRSGLRRQSSYRICWMGTEIPSRENQDVLEDPR